METRVIISQTCDVLGSTPVDLARFDWAMVMMTIDQICLRLYKKGASRKEIASRLDVNYSTVAKYVARAGFCGKPGKYYVTLLQSGKTRTQISQECGVEYRAVCRTLRRHGWSKAREGSLYERETCDRRE